MTPHNNVIARPLFLVTVRYPDSGIDKVCGFLLKFYPGPQLRAGFKAEKSRWDFTVRPKWIIS